MNFIIYKVFNKIYFQCNKLIYCNNESSYQNFYKINIFIVYLFFLNKLFLSLNGNKKRDKYKITIFYIWSEDNKPKDSEL